MDFLGKICPYCKTEFKEGDDVVVCSICEMPHHKECWIENKACTTFGCTGTIVGTEQYVDAVEKRSFCSKCGAAVNDGHKFCTSCGAPVGATGEPHIQVSGAYTPNQVYQQNSYSTPQTQYIPQHTTPPQNNSMYNSYGQQQVDQEMFTFIHKNQPFYIDKFQKMQLSNSNTSWNWCSFLFGAYWFAYRKMYGIAAAYAGISFVLSLIPGLGGVLGLAMSICAGIFGNNFYKQYVDSEIQVARNMDPMNKNIYIAQKGGTSVGAVWVVIGIMAILGMIIGSSM